MEVFLTVSIQTNLYLVRYQGNLKYTVRRVLPKKQPISPIKEEKEVRLNDEYQSMGDKAELKKRKIKEKRQKYKKNKKIKMNNIKAMEVSQPELDFIKMIKYIEDSDGITKEISDQKYANKLNILSNLWTDYTSDDYLEL